MTELEDAGWRKAKEKAADQVTDVDIKSVFNLVDIDKSGTVSRTVGGHLTFPSSRPIQADNSFSKPRKPGWPPSCWRKDLE